MKKLQSKHISKKINRSYLFKQQYLPLIKKIKELTSRKDSIRDILIDGVNCTESLGNYKVSVEQVISVDYKKLIEDLGISIPDKYVTFSQRKRVLSNI